MRPINILATVLKIIVGGVFLFSAVSKFVTIDAFEMYVYSFGLFPMGLCFYLSRLLIGAELILGVALISHRNHRFTLVTSLLFLLFFVGFLVYAQLIGRTDSCHCFGDLLPFNPVQSILKNAILIIILLFVYKYANHEWHPRWWLLTIIYVVITAVFTIYTAKELHAIDPLSWVMMAVTLAVAILASFSFYSRWYFTVLLVLAPIVTTFILSPPDSWYFSEGDTRYDEELFMAQLEEPVVDTITTDTTADFDPTSMKGALYGVGLDNGRHLVAFFSPTCGYCRLAAEKITTIVARNDIPHESILFVFPAVSDESKYQDFYQQTHSPIYPEVRIDRNLFVHITRAAFPIIMLIDNGAITASYSYRAISEEEITDFLAE